MGAGFVAMLLLMKRTEPSHIATCTPPACSLVSPKRRHSVPPIPPEGFVELSVCGSDRLGPCLAQKVAEERDVEYRPNTIVPTLRRATVSGSRNRSPIIKVLLVPSRMV